MYNPGIYPQKEEEKPPMEKPPVIAEYEAEQAAKKAAKEEAEAKKFTVDKALDSEGFKEFLSASSDHETFDINDEKAVEQRFEVFQKKELVKTKLKDFCKTRIEADFGLPFNEVQESVVFDEIESKALNDPEGLLSLHAKIELSEKLPTTISDMEKEIAALGGEDKLLGRLEQLKVQKKNLETVDSYHKGGPLKAFKMLGEIFTLKSRKVYTFLTSMLPGVEIQKSWQKETAKREKKLNTVLDADEALANDQDFRARFGEVQDWNIDSISSTINADIRNVKKSMRALHDAEQAKKLREQILTETKQDLVDSVVGMKEMVEMIQIRVRREFKSLLDEGSTKSIDAAEDRLAFLQQAAEKNELGVDPLGEVDVDKLEEQLEDGIEEAAHQEVMTALENANFGKNALTDLEKSLKPLLERPDIGSNESKEFVIGSLEQAMAMLTEKPGDREKRLLVKRIIFKLKKKK